MKEVFIISDLLDPEKGSEFRIGLKAIEILCKNEILTGQTVNLFVPLRTSNIENIQAWLKQQNISNLKIKEFKFKRAQFNGTHSTRLAFILDLIFFYWNCRKEITKTNSKKRIILKSGQVNWFFHLIFFFVFKKQKDETILCAPISGFNYIRLRDCIGLELKSKLYYLFYNLIIWGARLIFKLFYISKEDYHFLFATYGDCQVFYKINIKERIYSEIELSEKKSNTPEHNSGIIIEPTNKNVSVLWSGHLVPRKNPLFAISVISQIVNKHDFVNFYFIGNGPLKKALQRHIRKENLNQNIQFRYISSLTRTEFLSLLDQVDLVLITSVREVNSTFFIESLIANKRIVAFRNSGLTDFELDNVTLLDSSTFSDARKFADAFSNELMNPASVKNNGYKYITTRFDYEKNNLINVIIKVLQS